MNNNKVTIIVTIYNKEKYIKKCIDSILNQTYKNLEILLINDGSKDNSLKIIRNYEKNNKNLIKILSHENHGLGYTRNVGLKAATGEYISFLDADDWIEKNYVETLVNKVGNNDIVISGFKRYNSNYKFEYEKIPKDCTWSKFKYISTAGKMFSREFIIKNKLKYHDLTIGEDAYFNINAYSKTKKIVVAEYAGYCNYENTKSMTNDVIYSEKKSLFYVLKLIVKDHELKNLNKKQFSFYLLKTLIADIILYKNVLSNEQLIKNYEKSIKWYKEYLKKNNIKFKFYYQTGEEFKINLLVNIFIFATKVKLYKILIKIIKKSGVSLI